MNVSKYAEISVRRLPREKKSISLYGEREDAGKYWKCWHCGFICDGTRDKLDTDSYGQGGVIPTTYTDTDGETKYYPNVVSGCPFCGSTNYR